MFVQIYMTDEGSVSFVDYTKISNLSFAPDIDLYALSLPINTFTVDIITDDEIAEFNYAELYDDLAQPWARYWITAADRISPGVVRLTAKSPLYTLEYATMAAEMYSAEPAADLIVDCIEASGQFGAGAVSIDSSLSNATITGYCPEQTARERLTWVLFAIGACARMSFDYTVRIAPIDDTTALISYNRTFWRPQITQTQWVTAVKVTAFTFTEAQSQAEWEADDSSYRFPLPWVCAEQEFTLTNDSAPAGVPENVVEVSELYLINSGNVNDILNRIAAYYFNRTEATLDCVNNREFLPGDKVMAYMAEDALITGYIASAAFKFGVQARSTLKLIGVEEVVGAELTINYVYSGGRIGQATYFLPVGYTFSIENPYIDRTHEGRRYIYRPQTANATGTMVSGSNTVTVNYDIALESHDDILIVHYVDGVETSSGVGVIS